MTYFVSVLLCICIALIISMWLCLSGQIISMKEELSDIKLTVNYTSDAVRDYFLRLWDHINHVNEHLTTEIACLAVKNNEDIKRVKEGFQKWDILKLGDDEYIIYHIEQCSDNKKLYRCQNSKGDTFEFFDNELTFAELVRSASPWLEEKEKMRE